MTYPLWVLNSTLFLILCGAAGFVLLFKEDMPRRFRIEVRADAVRSTRSTSRIDENTILDNDIFGTGYVKRAPVTQQAPQGPSPLPPPPSPVTVPQRKEPEVKFLKPLAVALKGIMYTNDDSMSVAILADKSSKEEKNYYVGDTVEDAQILRIFKNKVMFIRSNSQQEVLYLTEEDAQEDKARSAAEWDDIIKKTGDNTYKIDAPGFVKRVNNLARFIDLLDLTTVFNAGRSIGCRAENNAPDSLTAKLGLMLGDIIESIDGVPATDTQHRLEIYKAVIAKQPGDTVRVIITRRGMPVTLTYGLEAEPLHSAAPDGKKDAKPAKQSEPIFVTTQTPAELAAERARVEEQERRLAPTLQEIKVREKRNMLEQGKRRGQNSLARYVE